MSAGGAKARGRSRPPLDAERFIEQVGFAACLTDSRRPGPSLYVAVCGRRDAVMPPQRAEGSGGLADVALKDEIVRRGNVYYAKLARGKTMFLAPRMIPYFHAMWGVRRADEPRRLSRHAQAILRVLRASGRWPPSDLREASGRQGPRGLHARARRAAGGDDRRAERSLLPAEVHLHLDARRRTLSGRAAPTDRPRHGAARDRALLSRRAPA